MGCFCLQSPPVTSWQEPHAISAAVQPQAALRLALSLVVTHEGATIGVPFLQAASGQVRAQGQQL